MRAGDRPARPPRLGRLAGGEAGPAPALALAIVALLSAFIAIAGPRELAAAGTAALRQQLAALSSLDTGAAVTAQWQAYRVRPSSALAAGQVAAIGHNLAGAMHPPVVSPGRQRWAGVTTPQVNILNPPPGTTVDLVPEAEIAYRSGLAANAHLVSGSLPGASAGAGRAAGPGTGNRVVTVGAAVTTATAARFGLHPGSRIALSPYQPEDPGVVVRVTGLIRPADPSAAFWQYDPVLAAPQITGPPHHQYWFAGVFIGPGALTTVQDAFSGATEQGTWFFPLSLGGLTAAGLPRLLTGINALTSSNAAGLALAGAGGVTLSSVGVSANLGSALGAFNSQQQAVAAIDALLIVGLVTAGLILILVCARLAVDAHRGELTLLRARGASAAQAAARMFVLTGLVTAPALAVGAALAMAAVPGGGNRASWLLGGVTALAALAGPPVIAGWRHRRGWPAAEQARDGGLADTAPARAPVRRWRRTVIDLAVVAAATGSLVALRQRGTVGGTDPFLSASPVLVAAAAGLLVARAYPAVVRAMLAAAAGSRGVVGFLGLASAARSRLGAVLPALTLVLTLTLAAFAGIISESVAAGQQAASWQQVGADVLIQPPGDSTVPAAAQRAVGTVPGIRHTAAVYTAAGGSPFAATLVWQRAGAPGPAASLSVGLAVVNPSRYAALAAGTPWPGFPAGLLSRGKAAGGGAGVVPVLAAPGLAAGARRGAAALVLDGIRLPVAIVGRIGATPAVPAGGPYVMMPSWAAPRFPSIPGPRALLATGTPTDLPALRAAIARTMPGSQLTLRRQVLAGLADAPAQRAGARLSALAGWAAVAFSVVALLFGLAVSARRRDRLITRLSALGMTPRQARALALADTLPLLCVAIGGMLAAVAVLTPLAGPALNLTVFTGSAVPVPVRPGPLALLIPAVAVAVLTVAVVAAERAAAGRHDTGTALRHQEVM